MLLVTLMIISILAHYEMLGRYYLFGNIPVAIQNAILASHLEGIFERKQGKLLVS